MDILNKKLEEKFKLFEKIDKMNSSSQTKINSLDLSDSNRLNNKNIKNKNLDTSSAKKSNNNLNNIDNINKFDNIYSNFDMNQSYTSFYYKNYVDVMNHIYSNNNNININNKKSSNKKEKGHKKSKEKNISKSKIDIRAEYKTDFLPKKDYVIDRLQRYGKNIEKKKELIKELNLQNLKKKSNPKISKYAKKLNRDPDKFVERLFYNKKDFQQIYINNNLTFKPKLSQKTIEIANKLEPSSKRLLKKKKPINKIELEKLAINNYKNLINNNNYNKNKKISGNVKKLVNKLYNGGLKDIKKKEMIYQENLLKKNEEYKNYSFQPNATKNVHKSKSLKYLNDHMYTKQIEWKNKKMLDNFKKKEFTYDLFLDKHCSFKPNISHEIIKDDIEMINRNKKDLNNYVEKRRKQIREKEKEKLNKSFTCHKIGFSLKDIMYEPIKDLNTERISHKKTNCQNLKKVKKNIEKYKNSFDFIIPQPYTNRIFYYYNENLDSNNFRINNNLNNVNYSQLEFVNAINSLHKEINNLNI